MAISPLIYALVAAEAALALAAPVRRGVEESVQGAADDFKALGDGGKDIQDGHYRQGWDKLPRWAQITVIVAAVVVVLVVIGIISCCVGCLKCATCNCCSCCCSGCGGGGRSRETHHHHYAEAAGGTRNTYMPMNDMRAAPTPYDARYEPTYEPPQYATYEPIKR